MSFIDKMVSEIKESVIDDNIRFKLQYVWVYRILGLVSLYMTVVNIFTAKYLLMASTAVFALACGIDIIFLKYNKIKVSYVLFTIELFVLFIFFIISGTPEGFSAIWICMLPTCGLILFGRKKGSIICGVMFALLIFFFWSSVGRSMLDFAYTDSFLMRFPMLYVAFYFVSLFLETVREMTQRRLVETRNQFHYLYLHDALTGIYNRYGFNEIIENACSESNIDGTALLILDIDFFKSINDKYGHINGDMTLKYLADLFVEYSEPFGKVCRWGGEEFAILLNQGQGAFEFAEKLRVKIENEDIKIGDITINLTVSIGVAIAMNKKSSSIDVNDFVTQADNCLYSAKKNGRNKAVVAEI